MSPRLPPSGRDFRSRSSHQEPGGRRFLQQAGHHALISPRQRDPASPDSSRGKPQSTQPSFSHVDDMLSELLNNRGMGFCGSSMGSANAQNEENFSTFFTGADESEDFENVCMDDDFLQRLEKAAEQVLRSNPVNVDSIPATSQTKSDGPCLDPEKQNFDGLDNDFFAGAEDFVQHAAPSHAAAGSSSSRGVSGDDQGAAGSTADFAPSAFLSQLEQAHASAVAAGDTVTADAVAEAIRAERTDMGLGAKVPVRSAYSAKPQAGTCQSSKGKGSIQRPPLPASIKSSGSAACSTYASPPAARAACRTPSPRLQNLSRSRQSFGHAGGACGPTQVSCVRRSSKNQSRSSSKDDSYIDEDQVEEDIDEVEEGDATSDPKKPVRLGSVQTRSMKLDQLFEKVRTAKRRSITHVGPLGIEKPMYGSYHAAVQASDLLEPCRIEVLSWAKGLSSGKRCLFMVDSMMAPEIGLEGDESRASMHSLSALCGLPGGHAFLGEQMHADVFLKSPCAVLREAVASIRREAQVDGPLTAEEVNLGLRSLQMQAKSQSDPAASLRVQIWRELLKAHIAGSDVEAHSRCIAMHQELAKILRMSVADLEMEAKHESVETLRGSPPLWDEIRGLLSGMAKALKADIDVLESQGPYSVLGVAVDATDADIKKVYRELCLKHHPDKGGDTATFQQLQHAYDQITEDRKRGIYPKSKPARTKQEKPPDPPQRPPDPPPEKDPFKPARPFESRTRSRERNERKATDAEAEADAQTQDPAEAAAQQQVAETLWEVQRLNDQAAEAASRATKAAQSALEATHAVNNAALQCDGDDALDVASVARDAARRLIRAMDLAASGADAVGDAVMELSTKAAAAGGLTANGSMAEDLAQVSLECAMHGTSAVQAAVSCHNAKDEVMEALTSVTKELERCEAHSELGKELAAAVVQLLADACTQGKAAASEAADCAEAGARIATQAFIAAQNAAKSAGVSSRRPRSRPPSSKETKAPATESQETGERSASSGAKEPKDKQSQSRKGSGNAEQAHANKPPKEEGDADSPSGQHSRPGSGGPRARNDALLQRRIQSFNDLRRLNGEVVELQQKMQKMLKNNPLFLPSVTAKQKGQIFAVACEFLADVVNEMSNASELSTQDLSKLIRYEFLTWLQLEQESGTPKNSLGDSRTGLFRLAALIDKESLVSLLEEQFLAKVAVMRPDVESCVRDIISRFMEGLEKWITAVH